MIEPILGAAIVALTVAVVALWRRVDRLEALLRLPPPPPVTINERRPLAPGVVPRGTPYHGGRLASRLEARTQPVPRAVDTAEMVAWDARVAAKPHVYLADGSPVEWRPDGSVARAHERYRHRYEPLGANQLAVAR